MANYKYKAKLNDEGSYDILAPNHTMIASVNTRDQSKEIVKILNEAYAKKKAGNFSIILDKIKSKVNAY